MKKISTLVYCLVTTFLFSTANAQCDAPTGLVTVYNNNVTTFSWNGVPGAVDYTLEIKYPAYNWNNIEYQTTVTTNSLSLTGIIQSATFDWRVSANCGSSTSNFTEAQVIIPCPQPFNLNTTNITTSSATLNWTPAPGYNTIVSDFIVAYRLAGSGNNWTQAGHASNPTKTITGLAAGTTYEWRVYQTCAYFNSSIVTSQFTTTSANGCNFPATISVNNIGNTSAVINWNAVSGASQYNLNFRKVGTSAWNSVNVNSTSYTLSNLLINTSYEYKLRSKCGGNTYSNFSPVGSFSTLNCVSYGNNSAEWIDLFKTGTINRSSGAEPGGYINTGLITDLTIGSSNPSQVSAGFQSTVRPQSVCVYIDFNRNGNFSDAGERVYGAAYLGNGSVLNFNINIPLSATPGTAGMRVVMRRNNTGTVSPCITDFLGETEDYTVNLVASSSRFGNNDNSDPLANNEPRFTVSPNPFSGRFNVTTIAEPAPISYEIFNSSGILIEVGTRKSKIFDVDLSDQPNGMYILKIKDEKGNIETRKLLKN